MSFYKKFSFKVIFRILLILLNLVLLTTIYGDQRLFFNQIIFGIILIIQIWELLHYIQKTNRELAKFILAIKHGDISINFAKTKIGESFIDLSQAFEEIIEQYKTAKIEKEAQFQYLKNIVSHLSIGIISVEDNEKITLFNTSAEQILNKKGINNWRILKEQLPEFTASVESQLPDGRQLFELKTGSETQTLSLNVSTLSLLDKHYTLITLQDIKNEIEQKEIEAWHKLIRILTHEIMNSATPISSLTETMQMMLEKEPLSEETLNDLRFSLKTIQKRSDGMLAFIDDYRKITKVPKPKTEQVNLKEFLAEIELLTKAGLKKDNITLKVQSETITAEFDQKLIEQVLLNLIKNAQQALSETREAKIEINAFGKNNQVIIEVLDNGPGISEELKKEIFVPFFTTKKSGSGIGLSLSKQIMHLHGGTIKLRSNQDETIFSLYFPLRK